MYASLLEGDPECMATHTADLALSVALQPREQGVQRLVVYRLRNLRPRAS